MVPRMVRDLVAFIDDLFRDVGVLRDALAETEECRLDIALLQHFQNARRLSRVRAIVESERDVRPLDLAFGERDPWRALRRFRRGSDRLAVAGGRFGAGGLVRGARGETEHDEREKK